MEKIKIIYKERGFTCGLALVSCTCYHCGRRISKGEYVSSFSSLFKVSDKYIPAPMNEKLWCRDCDMLTGTITHERAKKGIELVDKYLKRMKRLEEIQEMTQNKVDDGSC